MGVTINPKYLTYNSKEVQAILDHAEASLPLADTAVQPVPVEIKKAGTTTNSETIGGKTIATSGNTTYTIMPGCHIKMVCQSTNHSTYIIGINGNVKSILQESGYGEVNWTNETSDPVTVAVGCETVGDSYYVTITTLGLLTIVSDLEDAIDGKYDKPAPGIPATDLSEGVNDALTAGSEALQFEENNDPASLFNA